MKTRFTSIFSRAAMMLLLVIFAPPTEAWADESTIAYNKSDNYRLIASPLAEQIMDEQLAEILLKNNYDLYSYVNDNGVQEWCNYKEFPFGLEPCKGYLYANSEDVDLVFEGELYNGDGMIEVKAGWNLLGNSYNCEAYLANDEIKALPYYKLNGEGTGIVVVNSISAISSLEGFFYYAEEDGYVCLLNYEPDEMADVELPSELLELPGQGQAGNQEYTITWLDGDGNTLKTEQVASGQTPAYTGATPTKTATDQYTYTFNNTWYPEIVSVTGPATYTALFDATVNKYTVIFEDEDGTELSSAEYDYGTAAEDIVRPADPTKEATAQYTYTFNGWSPSIAMVTGPATYTATYSSVENPIVAYIDADGNLHNDLNHSTETTDDDGVQAIPLTGTETTLGAANTETWYVCNSNLTYTNGLTLNGNVHLILADGCTMNVGTSESRITDGNGINGNSLTNITIYGQTANSGTLSVYVTSPEDNGYDAIAAGGITINGGHIIANVDGDDTAALDAMDSNVTINGGKVEAIGSIGINANDDVIINGGQVTATGGTGDEESGIYTDNGDITLGWKNLTDFIKASSYKCYTGGKVVKTADGKALKYTAVNNTVKLIGTVSNVGAIAGQTLTPYGIWGYCGKDYTETTDVDESKNLTWDIPLAANATSTDQLGNTLTIQGNGDMADYSTTDAPWKEQTVNLILVATEGDYTAHSSKLNDGDKAKLAPNVITVAKNESGWGTYCHGYPVTYSLSEGTAYTISGLSDNNTNVSISDDLGIAEPAIPLLLRYSYEGENVILTAQPETAPAAVSSTAIVSSDFEGGSFYGNCSNTFVSPADLDDSYDEGQTYLLYNGKFIQADENGGLGAHKCLLVLSGTNGAPVLMIGEGTTNITTTNYTNFTNSDGAWYSLDGRRIANGQKPKAKGIYIHNSKKVVIK